MSPSTSIFKYCECTVGTKRKLQSERSMDPSIHKTKKPDRYGSRIWDQGIRVSKAFQHLLRDIQAWKFQL
jgi:hypothetical protein